MRSAGGLEKFWGYEGLGLWAGSEQDEGVFGGATICLAISHLPPGGLREPVEGSPWAEDEAAFPKAIRGEISWNQLQRATSTAAMAESATLLWTEGGLHQSAAYYASDSGYDDFV